MALHYKKDGSLDMRYSSSRAAMGSGFGMASSGYSGGSGYSPMSFGSRASSGLHLKKDNTLDMRYASSRAAAANAFSAQGTYASRPSSSSGLHHKKDGTLDMRYSSSRVAASVARPIPTSRPPSAFEHHYKKDGTLDMRYSSSRHAATSMQSSHVSRPSSSSDLHYKKDGTLDMRYASSKSTASGSARGNAYPHHGIPSNVPLTKSGLPDMRTTAAKAWVQQQAQNGSEDVPSWIPRTKDGSPDISKAITQEYFKGKDASSTKYDPHQRLDYYLQKLEDMFFRNLVENAREDPVEMPEYQMLPETPEIQQQFAEQPMRSCSRQYAGEYESPADENYPGISGSRSQYSLRSIHNSIRQNDEYDIRSEISETVQTIDYRDLHIDPDRKLGQGSFGTVYKGTWNGQVVAIKQLHLDKLTRQEKKSFVKEIQIMSTLGKHQNLVELYGYTLEPLCLVMAYVRLGSLSYLLHYCEDPQIEAKITDGRIKKKLILGIVLGMIQLHTCYIVHGDLKPQNILVSEDYTAKVTDFGFATLRGKTSSSIASSVTADPDSPVCGTAAYMAPELLDSSSPPKYSSDVYSFGVMLNEIIQEEEPYSNQFENFLGRGPFAAVNYARMGNRPRISSSTPPFLRNFIEQCWHRDPRSRPSFEQIFSDLKHSQMKFPNSFD